MREWWLGLERRERRVLLVGAVFVLAVAFYVLAWSPLADRVRTLDQSHAQAKELLDWTIQARARLHAHGPDDSGGAAPAAEVSPMLAVERSARAAEVLESIVRRRPDGQSGVQVALEGADFDRLPGWLATLEQKYGLAVARLVVTPRDQAGTVDARLELERPEP